MSALRTFIIEDNIIHASRLEMLLEELGYLVAGTTDSSDEALGMIAALAPDLLLIDIMINGQLDGVALAEKIQQTHDIPVIFITSVRAKDTVERAMKLKPYAFILKPFEKITLQTAIELAIARFANKSPDISTTWDEDQVISDFLFIKSNGKLDKISLQEIHYIEVRDKISVLALYEDIRHVRIPLSVLETKLDSRHFVRVHRSFIVNLRHITQLDWSGNVILIGTRQIPVGRYYREKVKEQLDAHRL